MASHLPPAFDALYCDEERFDEDFPPPIYDFNQIQKSPFCSLSEHDLFWEDDEIVALISKEKTQTQLGDAMGSDGCLIKMRDEAVRWMFSVIGRYGFTAATAVLAVHCYDRFVTSVCFQRDKAWMSQLAAVACLSVAAKVEETNVPLLMDFQVEESKYLFEAKTIQRMELLVLSALQWRMNPVTPINFFDHIVRRFELIDKLHWEFVKRCESVLLSIITDCRFVHYLPSVIAASVMKYVIKEIEPCDVIEYQTQVMSALRTSKEIINDCYKLIVEVMDHHDSKIGHKRKHEWIPSSPSGVIDAYFSSDSSNDSWAVGSSISSSPEPLIKRSRAQEQHMRLAPPLSTVSWRG